MFERLDPSARRIFERAQHEARQLDHRYIGTEHLLLTLASDDPVTASVLAVRGIGPAEIRGEIVSIIGRGQPEQRNPDVLLAALGIDLGEVRQRVEATFGADATSRAALATRPRRRRWPGSRWWPGCDRGRPCNSALAGGNWFGFAPRLKKVIEIAVDHSNPRLATPTDLFLATLQEGKGVACQILERRNVNLTDLATSTRSHLH